MMGFSYGFLGHDTNNATEIEGLLHGLGWVLANFRILVTVEGDSQMIILLATKLQNGSRSAKVSPSWHLESRLDSLRAMLINGVAVRFSHVR